MVCHIRTSLISLKPYRHFFSKKHHTSMSQSRYGSQCMHDHLQTYAIALSREHGFQLCMHQKTVCRPPPPGPLGGSQHSHRPLSCIGGWDPRRAKGHRMNGGKGREKRGRDGRGSMEGGRRDRGTSSAFFPIPALGKMIQ